MNENELKKLITLANSRIARLEKMTGLKKSYAVKELADYLDTDKINAWSDLGRIRLLEEMSESQKIAIEKATKRFLNDDLSKIEGVRKLISKYEKESGKKISFRYGSTMYNLYRNWKYYQDKYDLDSTFWQDIAPYAQTLSKQEFIDIIGDYISKEIDKSFQNDMSNLYDYLKST